jgi:hypothetical protein
MLKKINPEGYRKVNMVEILCTHACKWKNKTCWNILQMGEEG